MADHRQYAEVKKFVEYWAAQPGNEIEQGEIVAELMKRYQELTQ